jgi:nicotinamidase-related amidase
VKEDDPRMTNTLPALDRTAVIVIDMHRGSLEPPGTVFVPGGATVVPVLAALLAEARSVGVPVIHIVHQIHPDGSDANSPFWREAETVGSLYPNVREQVIGSRWTEIADGLTADGDYVLPKKRYGAFSGNGLDFLLSNLGIETLVLTGVETEICILATAYHAFNVDYRVVVASDGTAGLEPDLAEAALRIIGREVGWVATCEEIAAALRTAAAGERRPLEVG